MSKDLKKEYKVFTDNEAPDLWARIEAGLEEKPVSQYCESRVRKRRNYKVWVGLAACACVALSIPVIIRYFPLGSNLYTEIPNNNTMECAPEIAQYAEAGGVAVGLTDETAFNEGISPTAMNRDFSAGLSDNEGMNTVPSGNVNKSFAEEAAQQEGNSFAVTVEILDSDTQNSGVLYTARVITSENTDVQVGSEIKIFGSTSVVKVISLEESQTYELILTNSAEESVYLLQVIENP